MTLKNLSLPRILVTGAGGDSAIGVIKALRKARTSYVIYAVCIDKNSAGLKMADYHAIVPPVSDINNYISSLIELINRWSINILIPTVDSEIIKISKFHNKFNEETKCKIIIGKNSDILTCSNKQATSEYLASIEINHPKTFTSKEEVSLSLQNGGDIIAKPCFGGGSKGINLLSADDLKVDDWFNDTFIYQEFERYSKEVTSVVLKDDSRIVGCAVFERVLANGRTVWCKRLPERNYSNFLTNIARGLNIPYINIQFGITADGRLSVFDINPRFSGSTSVFARVFNGPELLVEKLLTGSMPKFIPSTRFFESTIYYEDWIYNEY
jgi:carbamoyl-phosphate synthase large subunit